MVTMPQAHCHWQILCWELVSKRGGSWILHYVKSAYAETDVPDTVSICAQSLLQSQLDEIINYLLL